MVHTLLDFWVPGPPPPPSANLCLRHCTGDPRPTLPDGCGGGLPPAPPTPIHSPVHLCAAQIITGDVLGYVKLWDVRTLKCVQTLNCGEEPPNVEHTIREWKAVAYMEAENRLLVGARRSVWTFQNKAAKLGIVFDDACVEHVVYNQVRRARARVCVCVRALCPLYQTERRLGLPCSS